MKHLRRLIAWSCFLGSLSVVGMVVFQLVRYAPRFVVQGKHEVVHISDDGRWLVTGEIDTKMHAKDAISAYPGRCHVYDSETGMHVRSFDVRRSIFYPSSSPGIILELMQSFDGKLFAWVQNDKAHLIDWRSGSEWTVPIGKAELEADCAFSEKGRWLVVRLRMDNDDIQTIMIDVSTHEVARRFDGPVLGFIENEDLVVHCADKYRLDFVNMTTGKVAGSIKTGIDLRMGHITMLATPDSKWIGLGHQYDRFSGSSFDDFEVWDVVRHRKTHEIRYEEANSTKVVFSSHGRFFATWRPHDHRYEVSVRDFTQDAPLVTRTIVRARQQTPPSVGERLLLHGAFSPDDRHFLLNVTEDNQDVMLLFDLGARRQLWEKRGIFGEWVPGRESQILCFHENRGGAQLLDPLSGDARQVLAPDVVTDFGTRLFSDGLVLLRGTLDRSGTPPFWDTWLEKLRPKWLKVTDGCVVIAESTTGYEKFRLRGTSDFAWLSDDGGTLATWSQARYPVTGPEPNWGVQLWSVHPHRAYFWAIVWSLGAGGVLLLVRHWRMKRKAGSRIQGIARQP